MKDSKESEIHAHCFSLSDFVAAYSSLPLVRQSVTGYSIYGDKSGVNEAFCSYLNGVYEVVKEKMVGASDDQLKVILHEIESYLTRKIYLKVYPVNDTLIDQAFWSRCKTLEWMSYDHLDIPEKNRGTELWDYCSKLFSDIDNKLTPVGKLNCMIECFKTIAYIVGLSSTKGDNASADDTLPIFIYVILNAFPRRIYSSLNFINVLQRKGTLLAEAGYCLTNVQSTVSFLENIESSMIKLDKTEFQRMIHDKEVKYEIFFLRTRSRFWRQQTDLTEMRKLYRRNDNERYQQEEQNLVNPKT